MAENTPLDAENPWPGLAAFNEDDQYFFRGRWREADEMGRLLRRERLTVLFGRSGLGKSSLLRAGLFPGLREDLHLPVYVRISYGAAVAPRQQVWDALSEACATDNVQAPPPEADESLWAYFHRAGAGFWNARRRPLLPVLVFDQFEELFTVGRANEASRVAAQVFIEELADLVEDRPSETLRRQLDADPARGDALDFERRGCKIVLSFREDFLAEVEGLRHRMPSVMRNRFRLLPMDGEQARAVIGSGGDLVSPEVAERIIGLAWRNVAEVPSAEDSDRIEIDPALLSVICSELNLRRRAAGAANIHAELLLGAEREILADFYERTLNGLDPAVRAFVEDELITATGFRDSFAFEDALARPGITDAALDHLVSGRLLRVDERFGVRRLELTHDVLTRVVKESRDMRRARLAETAARLREEEAILRQRRVRRKQVQAFGVMACAIALLLFAGWSYWQARLLADEAAATDLIARARAVPPEQFDLQLLLGTEAILRYPHRVEAQVELFSRMLSAEQVRKIWQVGANVASASAQADGNHILLGTDKGTLVELEPPDWRPRSAVEAHKKPVIAVAWTADRRTAVSATREEVVVSEWPAGKFRMRLTLPEDKQGIRENNLRLSVSPDGTLIAAGSAVGVRVWSLTGSSAPTPNPVDLHLGTGFVNCLGFDVERRGLFIGVGYGLWRWDPDSGRSQALQPPAGTAFAAFSPDCTLAVSARTQQDRRTILHLLNIRKHRDEGQLGKKGGYEFAEGADVLMSDDGRVALVRDLKDLLLLSTDTTRSEPLASVEHKGLYAFAFAHSADGEWSALAYGEDVLRLDRTGKREGEFVSRAAPHTQFLFFGSAAGALVSIAPSGEVRVLNAEPQRPLREADGEVHRALQLDFNRTGTLLGTEGQDPEGLQLWDSSGNPIGPRLEGAESIYASPDGTLTVSHRLVGDQSRLEIRSVSQSARSENLREIPLQEPATAQAISWDNRRVAVATEHDVTVYEISSGRVLAQLSNLHDSVSTIAFSPSQDLLAIGIGSGVDFLDVGQGTIQRHLDRLHEGNVQALNFSSNGALLATIGEEGKIVMTRVSTGDIVARDDVPRDASVFSSATIVFIEGDRLLSIGTRDGAKEIRDIAKRTLLATIGSNDVGQHLKSVALSTDQRRAALLLADGTITTRDWRPETLVADACGILGRNLTCVEWRQFIGDMPYRKTCSMHPDPVPACSALPGVPLK